MTARNPITRRTVLKGLGACLALPWLEAMAPRRRRTAQMLAAGHGTLEVAREVGVSAPAISQARSALYESWLKFQGEEPSACG